MNLIDLRDLLVTIGKPVFHHCAIKQSNQYIVWAEDGEGNSGHADNHKTIKVYQGTIDYFTKVEYDPVVNQIEDKLNSANIAWRQNSIQYEEKTEFIHYEWIWEMV